MKQVHIVSLSPRSGTTLMMELMVNGFDFDGHCSHELEVAFVPNVAVERFCSKAPRCLSVALPMLRRRRGLWMICVLRDPRDVVVSRHHKDPDAYWADLHFFRERIAAYRAALRHDRFIVVRYEELVSDPDRVQAEIAGRIGWLQRVRAFSDFEQVAAPSALAVQALGGVRKVSNRSVGRWREELPRLKAQVDRYGPIDDLLVELGYEADDAWSRVLDGVAADNGRSHFEDLVEPPAAFWRRRKFRRRVWFWRAMLGVPPRHGILLRTADVAGKPRPSGSAVPARAHPHPP